jgi:hypothetical protein
MISFVFSIFFLPFYLAYLGLGFSLQPKLDLKFIFFYFVQNIGWKELFFLFLNFSRMADVEQPIVDPVEDVDEDYEDDVPAPIPVAFHHLLTAYVALLGTDFNFLFKRVQN